MEKLIVPRRWSKGTWQARIRQFLELREDGKFRHDERIQNVYITPELKCLVTVAKPIKHNNPYDRIEFESETHQIEFQIVSKKCNEVMEG